MHYQRWKKRGTVELDKFDGPQDRFRSKIDIDPGTGCWLWNGTLYPRTGYANFWLDGKSNLAHRIAYRWWKGEIPVGYQLDHLCKVRRCVNPDHLEAVTPRVNNLRSMSPPAINARKTHCKRGHEYTPENTHIDARSGARLCRACRAA